MITAHTPKYNADGSIELTVKFPWLSGEVPFCATATDPERHGRDLFASASAGEYGPIAPYVAPPVVVVIQSVISAWQMRKALNQLDLRAAVEAAVSASTDQNLKDGWIFAKEFNRTDPLVVSMGAALGKTAEEMDALFALGASL